MINTEYLTQILLKSTKTEDPVVFFRRVQRKLWSLLPYFFPEVTKDGGGILDALTFDDFSKRHSFHTGLNDVEHVTGRNLETANLCSHAVTISRAGESAHVPGQSDHTYQTEICIEAAKHTDGKPAFVRFSYMTNVVYQPFAGFYPLADRHYETPEVIDEVLRLPSCESTFMPRLDCIRKGSLPSYRYPVWKKVIFVKDEKLADDFLARLADRARPICFLVYMGNSGRLREEAEYMASVVYTKAWVYAIERPELIMGKINAVIHNIDVRLNFKVNACRLFFPFGSYSFEDFANPIYPVRMFGRTAYRAQVLNGLLRFFDINEPGWRRTQRDIHMLQLDLNVDRELARKSKELEAGRSALDKKDAIISLVLEARKTEKEAIEVERNNFNEERAEFEGDNKRLDAENKRLASETANLQGQVEALKQQIKQWQDSGQQACLKFGAESLYPNEVYDHIVEMLRSLDGSIPKDQLRHRQIYEALVEANRSSGEMQKRKDAVVEIVRNKCGLSKSDIHLLETLGFTYSKGGSHHKFTMGSFFMTMPCTGSDSARGWKNSVRDFNRNFFVPTKGD